MTESAWTILGENSWTSIIRKLTARRRKLYTSVEMLQHDLDEWLHYCNYERLHQGYRNLGRRPIETIEQHLENAKKEG